MRIGSTKLAVIAIGTLLGVVATTGTAFAYYKTSVAGTTATNGATTGNVTLTTGTVTVGSGQLSPGANVNVTVPVTPTYAGTTLKLTGVSATFSVTGSPAACTVNDAALQWNTTTSLPVTGLTSGSPVNINGNIAMGNGAANGCQGRSFTATITVTGRTA